MLGTTFYKMNKLDSAFTVWDLCLSVNNNPTAYRIIANSAIENRAFEKAIEILNTAKNKFDDNFIFLTDLARLYAITLKFEDAILIYIDILKNDENIFPFVKREVTKLF